MLDNDTMITILIKLIAFVRNARIEQITYSKHYGIPVIGLDIAIIIQTIHYYEYQTYELIF